MAVPWASSRAKQCAAVLAWLAACTGAASAVEAAEAAPAAKAAEAAEDADGFQAPTPPSYHWPAFMNWDCVGVRGVVDWDALYENTTAPFRNPTAGEPAFALPEAVVVALGEHGQDLLSECPLGALYFTVIYNYQVSFHVDGMIEQSLLLMRLMRRFPFFIIAGARWPTFEAFAYYSHLHAPRTEKAAKASLCEGVKGASGIDWGALLQSAISWSDIQIQGFEPGDPRGLSDTKALKAAADQIYKNPDEAGSAAQEECPFGFLFLCTTQVLAAAVRLTGSFEAWARALDKMLSELPFFAIAGSKWPTFRLLAMISSLSSGNEVSTLGSFQADVHRWGGAHPISKRFRRYGDLRLWADELCPLGRTPEGWSAVDRLVAAPVEAWYGTVFQLRMQKPRPVMLTALEGILAAVRSALLLGRRDCGFSGITAEACKARGCLWSPPSAEEPDAEPPTQPWCRRQLPRRKVVAVTFVWGERWARLVPRFAAWAVELGMGAVVVAMGDACRQACEAASMALGGPGTNGVACWDPLKSGAAGGSAGPGRDADRGSILQRHALVHLLLHLGVDALAFDFDTFLFEDPRRRLEEIAEAENADILMTRHLDADCLNMGLIYIRASARTAEWYSRYLQWLHQHPFEREQRGMNALLGFTKQRVSFPPKSLPPVKAAALDDGNEFASSRGGWLGDWGRLRFFHWVNPVETLTNWGDIKVADLEGLYKAGQHHSTDLRHFGGSLAAALGAAGGGSFLEPVRSIMDSMKAPAPPERKACW